MTSWERPQAGENSPPVIVSSDPEPGLVDLTVDGKSLAGSINFDLEVLDINNADDLEVYWYVDYVGNETPPCPTQAIDFADNQVDILGQSDDSRMSTFAYEITNFDPGVRECHRVEAIVCDGKHDPFRACASRACVAGAFEVPGGTWNVCVHSTPVGDCSFLECP